MTWDIPFRLGGPILSLELLRAVSRWWPRLLRWVYTIWLLGQFVFIFQNLPSVEDPPQPNALWGSRAPVSPLARQREVVTARAEIAADYLSTLLLQQLILLGLLTPVLTAGAVSHEKEQDTLTALLGTQLGSWEIITGKLLGRLAILLNLSLPAVPLMVFATILGDVGLFPLLVALAQATILTFALAAACLLLSVWTRRAGDAILACYAAIVLGYFIGLVVVEIAALPAWLDPAGFLRWLLQGGDRSLWAQSLVHLGLWSAIGLTCFSLAVARLIPASRGQADKRTSGWLAKLRPPVGNDPVRWRERYIIGLAPLPWLRMVPGWAGLIGVFTFSAILAGDALDHASGRFLRMVVEEGDPSLLRDLFRRINLERVTEGVDALGVIFLLLAPLLVGVRCSTSISEEKRRKTWEDLLLTSLPLEEIVRGKKWGVLQAAIPHAFIYAVPVLALGSLTGVDGVSRTLLWFGGAVVLMLGAAFVGAEISKGSEESKDSAMWATATIPEGSGSMIRRDVPRDSSDPRVREQRGWGYIEESSD